MTDQHSTVGQAPDRVPEKVTRAQWKAFLAAFGGWALDGYNASLFGFVLSPAMVELLPRSGIPADQSHIAFFGELGVAIFLFGWGCSFVWGPIADKYGRVPTLMASIIVYAVFTFLAGFSQNVWELNALRLLAAIGIGGEWSMAGTFVSEVMPEGMRARFGGLLHSGTYWGFVLGAIVNLAIGLEVGWRAMFFIGVLPALFVLYIRTQVKGDAAKWTNLEGQKHRPLWALFAEVLRKPYRRRSLVNASLVTIALIGFWASSQYLPTSVANLVKASGNNVSHAALLGTLAAGLLSMITALACMFLIPITCDRFGRRPVMATLFVLMIIGIGGGYGLAYNSANLWLFLVFVVIMGVGGANFAIFTIWLPEQYPTAIRASGFAFSTTVSRFLAAGGTFLIGFGISSVGIALPLALTALPFLVGLALLLIAPETRGCVLPQ